MAPTQSGVVDMRRLAAPRSPRIRRRPPLAREMNIPYCTLPTVRYLQLNRKTFVVGTSVQLYCKLQLVVIPNAPGREEKPARPRQGRLPIGRSRGRAGRARRRAGLPRSCFEFELGDHRILWGSSNVDAAALQPCNAPTAPGMRSQAAKSFVEKTMALSGCPRLRTISRVLPSQSATGYQGGGQTNGQSPNSAAFIHRTEKQKQGSESNTASSAMGSWMKERV